MGELELGVKDEEIKALCTVLGSVKQWKITKLKLSDKMGAEEWEALSKMADKGKVNIVGVSKSALRAANNQQVEALWQATDDWWWDHHEWSYDNYKNTIAMKSEDDAGLRKLLAFKQNQ